MDPILTGWLRNRRRSTVAVVIRFAELALWTLGLVLIGLYITARTHAVLASEQDLEAFRQARAAIDAGAAVSLASVPTPDRSLWSEGRISAYEESLLQEVGLPEAVLRIPAIDLQVPVYSGTSELNLNRGVALIEGTATPGTPGNIGIAGHRDGYFRGLKDMNVGDLVEVQTLSDSTRYRISEFMVVDPGDVHVLGATEENSLTLVTCYPFYFVGHAPRRYIARGVSVP